MKNLVYYHRAQNLTLVESINRVHDQIIPFWEKCRLPTQIKFRIIRKIGNLYNDHHALMKNYKRSNNKDKSNQSKYVKHLDQLFDISHRDSLSLIKNKEDREFLRMQRKSMSGTIAGVDRNLTQKENRSK